MTVSVKDFQKRLTIALLKKLQFNKISESPLPDPPASIALFAQERFGDIIMMSPLIRSLHKAYPRCEISIISVNRIADYLQYDAHVKQVLKAKHPTRDVKNILRSHTFDILFNTKDHPSVTFLYLTTRIKAVQRIGLDHPEHRGFFDRLLSPPALGTTVQTYLSLLDCLQIEYTDEDYIPYLPDGPVSEEVIHFSKSLQTNNVVAINLSASQSYKEWPPHKWAAFLTEINQPFIVIAMPKQMADKRNLESRFSHVIPSPPTKNIFDAGHLISHSRALLSPDTALVHIASCFNTPVIALYRQPLDLRKFPPFSKEQEVLMAEDLEISSIPVKDVIHAFHKLQARI